MKKCFNSLLLFYLLFPSFLMANDELKNTAELSVEVLHGIENFGQEICDETYLDKSEEQLSSKRVLSSFMAKCFESLPGFNAPKNFSEAIELAVEFNIPPQDNMLSKTNVLEIYNVNSISDNNNPTGHNWESKVGLFSHPMCENIDKYFIARNSSSKHSYISKVEDKIKKFTNGYNSIYREYTLALAIKKNPQEMKTIYAKMKKFYYGMLTTMAKKESLSDADSHLTKNADAKQSTEFYKYFGGSGDYSRPKGVKFYFDDQQSSEISKRNIGLYQFSPTSNIDDCFRAWNNTVGKRSQTCKIDFPNDRSKMKLQKFLQTAASDQIFNAFCGANKIVQSYGVQVNAKTFKNPNATSMQLMHKDNVLGKGQIKNPKDRCISPFAFSGNAFMHFGVLGFTDDRNTKGVIEGTLDYLK